VTPAGCAAPARPTDRLLSGRGFTFDGGVILAAVLIAVYVHRQRLPGWYMDAGAAGLPLGVAIGRIGDTSTASTTASASASFSLSAIRIPTR